MMTDSSSATGRGSAHTNGRPTGLFSICMIALSLLLAVPLLAPQAARADRPEAGRLPKHVILIDWDGVDPDYLPQASMPNLDSLISRGGSSIGRGTYKTISNPSRASMSTGAYPEVHGNAAYIYNPETNRVQGQSRFLAAETIAESLADEGRTIASVQWYMVQNHGVTYGDPEQLYVQPGGPCSNRVDAAIDILHQRPVDSGGEMVTVPKIPDFLAVYCSDPDGLGHAEGPNSPDMIPLLEEMDRDLGRLVQATKDVGIFGETAFIFTSDHGMSVYTTPLNDQVLEAIRDAGYEPEIVGTGQSPADDTEVIIVAVVRTGTIYLRGRAATEQGRADIIAALESVEGMERVLDQEDLEALRASPREGDLIAEPRPPYGFSNVELPAGEERGSHGSLAEIALPVVVSGAGFCRGVAPQDPELVDIAPTIAALLGTRPPADAQGRVLSEVMGPPACPAAPGLR